MPNPVQEMEKRAEWAAQECVAHIFPPPCTHQSFSDKRKLLQARITRLASLRYRRMRDTVVAFLSVLVTDVPKLDYLRFFRLSTVADDCERNQPRVLTQKCSMCVSVSRLTYILTNFEISPYPVHASRGP